MSAIIRKLLIIPHIKVHNANALSSPFTIGFPAMTAWLGAVHALQRQLNRQGFDEVIFSAAGVVSHDVNLQTYKGENDFVHSIVGTGNPLDKSGERSSFIEEPRCHLDVSLVIECQYLVLDEYEGFLAKVSHCLNSTIKIAGGDIQGFGTPQCFSCEEGDDEALARFKRLLMPGHYLIERRELMVQAMQEGADGLEALIDYLAIHHSCDVSIDEGSGEQLINWRTHRKQVNGKSSGWLVPIATGFQGVSPLGQALNQRDPDTSHRFAESIVTLGEFKMAHRLLSINEMLWRYAIDGDLYLCHQSTHEHLLATQVADDGNYSNY